MIITYFIIIHKISYYVCDKKKSSLLEYTCVLLSFVLSPSCLPGSSVDEVRVTGSKPVELVADVELSDRSLYSNSCLCCVCTFSLLCGDDNMTSK